MVEPITTGVAIKAGGEVVKSVSDAVGKVSDLLGKGLDIYRDKINAAERAQVREHDRQDQDRRLELDRQLARELYLRASQDRRVELALAATAADDLDAKRTLRKRYPVEDGPGSLRAGVHLLTSDARSAPPLVLFTLPRHVDPYWKYLLWRTRGALDMLETSGDAHISQTTRAVEWPHSELIRNDLYDVSTLIVTVEVVTNKLQIRLGGHNLGGERVRRMTRVVSTFLPGPDYFTSERLDALEATSGDGFRRPSGRDSLPELQMEWATRLAAVVVVAAVDGYYLMRMKGYREHIDEALDRLDQTMPPPTTLPLRADLLADPGYHLLHHARRLAAHGDRTLAKRYAADAVRAIAAAPNATVDDAARQARRSDRLEPWHIELLQDMRGLLPRKVATTLLDPEPLRQPDEATASQAPKPSGSATIHDAEIAQTPTKAARAGGRIQHAAPQERRDLEGTARGRPIRHTYDPGSVQEALDPGAPPRSRPIRHTYEPGSAEGGR